MSGRVMPTREGFWWGRWRDDHDDSIGIVPIMFFGDEQESSDELEGADPIAPIPSPAVCQALARYAEELVARDGWTVTGPQPVMQALADLSAAIRAEHAASVPA